MASRLFALEGAEVAEVDVEPSGGRTVWVVTADPAARGCPVCKTASEHVREQVATRPADVAHGGDRVSVVWVKRRRECRVASCPRQTFTESLPAVPPRCRVTSRLREHAGPAGRWGRADGGGRGA
jgi:transposase